MTLGEMTSVPRSSRRLEPIRPGRVVDDGDVRFHVREHPGHEGVTETAVYLPGLGAPALSFNEVGELLRPGFHGQALDMPGFGRSRAPGGYTVANHAAFTIRWIERGGVPVHLVGNSMGGFIALYVAATRPDLVRSLTLLNPAAPSLRGGEQARYIPALVVPHAATIARRRFGEIGLKQAETAARMILMRHCVDPGRVAEQRITDAAAEYLHCFREGEFIEAFLGTLRSAAWTFLHSYVPHSGSVWRMAGRVQAPTHIIWGARDRIFPVWVGRKLHAAMPGSRLSLLDDVGHVPHVEVPERVAALMLGRLRKAPRVHD